MKAEKKMYVIDYSFEPKNNSMRISSLFVEQKNL
jgi:hypothetical protein